MNISLTPVKWRRKIRIDSKIEPILFELLLNMNYPELKLQLKKDGYEYLANSVWEKKYRQDFQGSKILIQNWEKEYSKRYNEINYSLNSVFNNFTDFLVLTAIDLSNNNLKVLPKEFGYLKKLKKLYLNNNDFQTIPKQLEMLQLTFLDISNNKLKSVIKNETLKFLDVSCNLIDNLQIADLPNLQTLICGSNKIINFTQKINKIKELDLSNNLIECVKIKSRFLRKLNLRSNKLTTISLKTPKLKELVLLQNCLNELKLSKINLTVLDISNNFFDCIPEIGNQKKLKVFKASNNGIIQVEKITNFTNLEIIDLTGNGITNLPSNLIFLTKLREIRVSCNNLTKFSDNIFHLPKLEFIDIAKNPLQLSQREYTKEKIVERRSREGSLIKK